MRLAQMLYIRKILAQSILAFLLGVSGFIGCGASQDAEEQNKNPTYSTVESDTYDESWSLTADTSTRGMLEIHNNSKQSIQRIWLSPSSVEDFSVGYPWPETQQIAPGQSIHGATVEGWWDIWFEAESGDDATVLQVYFSPVEPTSLTVEPSWWAAGDLMSATEVKNTDTPSEDK